MCTCGHQEARTHYDPGIRDARVSEITNPLVWSIYKRLRHEVFASGAISVNTALFAFNLLQLAAQRSIGDAHMMPSDQQQDGRDAARQDHEGKQKDPKQHLHG